LTRWARTAFQLFEILDRRVFRESERRDEYTGMGTTIAATLFDGDSAVVCGVGDSRVYLIREAEISRLTQDHTWVETLLAQTPGLDREALANHPMRHVLTSVVGAQDDVEVTVTAHRVAARDRFVLCTDGVHGALPDARISAIVARAGSVGEAAEALVKAAVAADGKDNASAVVVEMAS
jgi:PPM family protein phosphatase